MKVRCSDACLYLHQVCEWIRKFGNGLNFVSDCPRLDQAHWVVKPELTAEVEHIMKDSYQVIATVLNISHGLYIIYDVLKFNKVLAEGTSDRSNSTFEGMMYCYLSRTFVVHWRRWWHPGENWYWRWILGPLPSLDHTKRRWAERQSSQKEEVEQVVYEWLCTWPKDFFYTGINEFCKSKDLHWM